MNDERCKICESCTSRRELSIEYLLANCGVDTAENGPPYAKIIRKLEKHKERRWQGLALALAIAVVQAATAAREEE